MFAAPVLALTLLAGCSLLYDPSGIATVAPDAPRPDAAIPVDAEVVVDADPSMLMLTGVSLGELVEGEGAGGSRPALLVIEGTNVAMDGVSVTLTPTAGSVATPTVTVDDAQLQVEANGRRIAVPIGVPVDATLVDGQTVMFDVTVTQGSGAGPVSQTLTAAVTLRGLDELDAPEKLPAAGFTGGTHEYAVISLASGTISAAADQTSPVILRSRTTITLEPAVVVDVAGKGRVPGPAGGAGGAPGQAITLNSAATPGGAGTGPGFGAGGAVNAVGTSATFAGARELPSLAAPHRSGGGGGGGGGNAALGAKDGGAGGAGGGSIALLADGAMTIDGIIANGAPGVTQNVGAVGGGGTGGVILLRADGALTAGTLNVAGSPSAGVVRVDASGDVATTQPPTFRGPMWVSPPLITTSEMPSLTVRGTGGATFRYYVEDSTGTMITEPVTKSLSGGGTLTFTPTAALFRGRNKLCLLVDGATTASDTQACVTVVHLYVP